MGRNDSYKVVIILGGLFGIFSVLSYYVSESLGAWWQITWEFWTLKRNYYINAFGYSHNRQILGNIGTIAGVVFLLGSFIAIIGAINESKNLTVLCSLMMFIGIGLFLYALSEWDDFKRFLDVLEFLSNEEYNIFYGSYGNWTWGLGTGFFIGTLAAFIVLIGAVKMK
ncbi:MAG: hypothetical protein ACFFDK_01120 [Promethearchaeota archaeon]